MDFAWNIIVPISKINRLQKSDVKLIAYIFLFFYF